jgi:hypothetical protein
MPEACQKSITCCAAAAIAPEALCIAPGDAVKRACKWGTADSQAQPVQRVPCKSCYRGQYTYGKGSSSQEAQLSGAGTSSGCSRNPTIASNGDAPSRPLTVSECVFGGICPPVWNSNCCLTSPVRPSQMMAVLSTEPLSSRSPFLFHFSEKMGPLWLFSVFFSSPAAAGTLLEHSPLCLHRPCRADPEALHTGLTAAPLFRTHMREAGSGPHGQQEFCTSPGHAHGTCFAKIHIFRACRGMREMHLLMDQTRARPS